MQSSIGRRLEHSFQSFISKDYESALVHFFPALDKTAKIRRPKEGVGSRIKSFLSDEEEFISFVAIGALMKNCAAFGVTFPTAIYKFGRTSVMHEGELDPRLQITTGSTLSIGEVWSLPESYISAMIIAVMAAKENANERFERNGLVNIHGVEFNTSDIWGNKNLIKSKTNMPDL
ncbi:hypothetical protein [Pantoea agglomerans]|uniref:hypothetical protein n=1 Tax=Enterobacter agglomerans TaxID=549 RepID=UPI0019D6FDF9|nr:hypothetical protein [Pantoea agglomerans]